MSDLRNVVKVYPDRVVVVTAKGPKGDTGAAGSGADSSLVTGSAAVALPAGGAVTRSYGAASATTSATPAIGLAVAAAGVGGAVTVRTAGTLTLADWTAATGFAALQPGAPYFVSDVTPGRIAVAVVTATGRVVQCVGRALTTDTLVIDIGNPLLL